MLKILKSHFSKEELVSIIQSFVAIATVDALMQFQTVMNGDLSKPALLALLGALGRSLLKAIIKIILNYPKKVLIAGPPSVSNTSLGTQEDAS